MIFQRTSPKLDLEEVVGVGAGKTTGQQNTEMETVVGPSVQVEGDFASEGSIIVRGVVRGSIHTTKHLLVDSGAKVFADIRVGTASILGEVKGNIKASEKVELASSAHLVGDIETQKLIVEDGALWVGKISMSGIAGEEETPSHESLKSKSFTKN